jgi:hypothetical protein
MSTTLTVLATLVAVALTGHLWLAFTDIPPLGGYAGFTIAILGIVWLVGIVSWLPRPC